jgi:hypothetical protein
VCRCKAKPMMGMEVDARHRTFLCRASPAKGMKTDVSAVQLLINPDADARPLFRQVSPNLAAAAMLLRGCREPATFEERRERQQLKALLEAAAAQQAESSTSRQRSERGRAGVTSTHHPNPPPPQQQKQGEGVATAASAVRSQLGPNRDARNIIDHR